jgi:hypothetical protein
VCTMIRRNVLVGVNAMAMSLGSRSVAAESAAPKTYDEALKSVWRPLSRSGGIREIVRAGTLGANSHNTQPWRFSLSDTQIAVKPDFSRRLPVVDPDDHHLFASLGCAVENMVQAASALGFKADARFDAGQGRVVIKLDRFPQSTSALADAIVKRQCTRAEYDGRAVDADDLALIRSAGMLEGVECLLVTERPRMEAILDYVVAGNSAQLRDPAFMTELIAWLRFNDGMAVETLDGLATRSSGNPSLPAWIARRLLPLLMTEKSDNGKYAKHIRSSAGIAVFAAASNDATGWVATGRAFQRFALQATALGIRQAFVNQPVEVQSLRPQIASYLGLGNRRPDLVVRFGRGPTLPASLRRPIDVLIDQA